MTLLIIVISGGVLIVAAVCLLGFQLVRDAKDGMKGWSPPKTGIVFLEGLPGSGKSYRAVKWLMELVEYDRRLIYTNLPLKLRVIRALLRKKSGEHRTNYIVELTKEHFFKSVARYADMTAYMEERSAVMTPSKAQAEFLSLRGPHVPRPFNQREWVAYRASCGVDADFAEKEFIALALEGETRCDRHGRLRPNWMEAGSAICVDEIHKWCDQRKQNQDDPRLLDFVTMHRHNLYYILLLTQNAMQASISLRRNCEMYWRAMDMRTITIFWGVKFPLPLFRYDEIPAGELGEQSDRTKVKPQRSWTECPFFDGGLVWRLYRSFTHAGSARKLKSAIERSRMVAEGKHYDPNRTLEQDMKLGNRQRWALRVGWLVVACGCVSLAWYSARKKYEVAPEVAAVVRPAASAGAVAPPVVASGGGERKGKALEPVGRVVAVGSGFLVLDGGRSVREGQSYDGVSLVSCASGRGLLSDGRALFVGDTWVRGFAGQTFDRAAGRVSVDESTGESGGSRVQWGRQLPDVTERSGGTVEDGVAK